MALFGSETHRGCTLMKGGPLYLAVLMVTLSSNSARAYEGQGVEGHSSQNSRQVRGRAHSFHVVYTVTESEAGKAVSVHHYALVVQANGRPSTLKVGTKNPALTGGYLHENAPDTTQFQYTYIDMGLNISSQVIEDAKGLQLLAKIDESSVVEPVNPQLLRDPTFRQNALDCSLFIIPGESVVLGSYDAPDSTRHFEVQAVLKRLP